MNLESAGNVHILQSDDGSPEYSQMESKETSSKFTLSKEFSTVGVTSNGGSKEGTGEVNYGPVGKRSKKTLESTPSGGVVYHTIHTPGQTPNDHDHDIAYRQDFDITPVSAGGLGFVDELNQENRHINGMDDENEESQKRSEHKAFIDSLFDSSETSVVNSKENVDVTNVSPYFQYNSPRNDPQAWRDPLNASDESVATDVTKGLEQVVPPVTTINLHGPVKTNINLHGSVTPPLMGNDLHEPLLGGDNRNTKKKNVVEMPKDSPFTVPKVVLQGQSEWYSVKAENLEQMVDRTVDILSKSIPIDHIKGGATLVNTTQNAWYNVKAWTLTLGKGPQPNCAFFWRSVLLLYFIPMCICGILCEFVFGRVVFSYLLGIIFITFIGLDIARTRWKQAALEERAYEKQINKKKSESQQVKQSESQLILQMSSNDDYEASLMTPSERGNWRYNGFWNKFFRKIIIITIVFGAFMMTAFPIIFFVLLWNFNVVTDWAWMSHETYNNSMSSLFSIFGPKSYNIESQYDILTTLGVGYQQTVFPWIFVSLFSEIALIHVFTAPSRRPKDSYDMGDVFCSTILGLLSVIVFKVDIFQWGWQLPLTQSWLQDSIFNYETLIHQPIVSLFDFEKNLSFFRDPNCLLSFFLCLLMSDLQYYLTHRISHITSWMWTAHAIHHSSEEYTLSTAVRGAFTLFITPYLLINTTPLFFFFDANMITTCVIIVSIYPFWLHLTSFPACAMVCDPFQSEEMRERRKSITYFQWDSYSFGHYFWFYAELYFNTPALHRVHHCRNNDLLSLNYASVFNFWDRMFGTFSREQLIEAPESVSMKTNTPEDTQVPESTRKIEENGYPLPPILQAYEDFQDWFSWVVVDPNKTGANQWTDSEKTFGMSESGTRKVLPDARNYNMDVGVSNEPTANDSTSILRKPTTSYSTSNDSGTILLNKEAIITDDNSILTTSKGMMNWGNENNVNTGSDDTTRREMNTFDDRSRGAIKYLRSRDDIFYGTIPTIATYDPWLVNWEPIRVILEDQRLKYGQSLWYALNSHWTPPLYDIDPITGEKTIIGYKKCPVMTEKSKINPREKMTHRELSSAVVFSGCEEAFEDMIDRMKMILVKIELKKPIDEFLDFESKNRISIGINRFSRRMSRGFRVLGEHILAGTKKCSRVWAECISEASVMFINSIAVRVSGESLITPHENEPKKIESKESVISSGSKKNHCSKTDNAITTSAKASKSYGNDSMIVQPSSSRGNFYGKQNVDIVYGDSRDTTRDTTNEEGTTQARCIAKCRYRTFSWEFEGNAKNWIDQDVVNITGEHLSPMLYVEKTDKEKRIEKEKARKYGFRSKSARGIRDTRGSVGIKSTFTSIPAPPPPQKSDSMQEPLLGCQDGIGDSVTNCSNGVANCGSGCFDPVKALLGLDVDYEEEERREKIEKLKLKPHGIADDIIEEEEDLNDPMSTQMSVASIASYLNLGSKNTASKYYRPGFDPNGVHPLSVTLSRYFVLQWFLTLSWCMTILGMDASNIVDERFFYPNSKENGMGVDGMGVNGFLDDGGVASIYLKPFWVPNTDWIITSITNFAIFFLTLKSSMMIFDFLMLGKISRDKQSGKGKDMMWKTIVKPEYIRSAMILGFALSLFSIQYYYTSICVARSPPAENISKDEIYAAIAGRPVEMATVPAVLTAPEIAADLHKLPTKKALRMQERQKLSKMYSQITKSSKAKSYNVGKFGSFTDFSITQAVVDVVPSLLPELPAGDICTVPYKTRILGPLASTFTTLFSIHMLALLWLTYQWHNYYC